MVCDSRDDIRATRAMLLDHGINGQVVVAHDGDEALRLLQPEDQHEALHPAALLLDLRTPRMNGFDFLIHLRANPATRELPVVILPTVTAQTPTRELLSGEEYADDSTVPKPRTARELITALRAWELPGWRLASTRAGPGQLIGRAFLTAASTSFKLLDHGVNFYGHRGRADRAGDPRADHAGVGR